jgi:lipopolysaccharide exporter
MLNESSEKAITATPEIEKGIATFADNVLTLAGGTTLALGVSILASPITSRLFGPEAFGLAALFRSGAATLAAIACLRYEMAIVLPKKDEDAAPLFALCCTALVVMTIFAAVLTMVFGNRALLDLNAVELTPILWLFPVYVFLMGSLRPLSFWYIRQKQFKINAASSILASFPISMAEITGGWAGLRTGENLVVIRIFGLIFAPAFLVWRLFRGDAGFIIRNINPRVIIKAAKRYIKFPMLDTGSVLLASLSITAPVLILTTFFSPAICGLYTKALYLLLFPSIVIGKSVGRVFLQESAAAKAAKINLAGLFEMVFYRMITIGTLPFAILAIISPELFELFLGNRWAESGVYAQILMPQLFLGFLFGSIATLFGTLGKQELNLISNALLLFLRVAILIYGGLMLRDVRLTLFIYMVANVLIILWRISFLIRAIKVSATRPLTHFLRCIAYVIPSVMPIAALKWWYGLETLYLVVLTPIFAIPYIALVLRHDLELRNLFSNYFQRVLLFKR